MKKILLATALLFALNGFAQTEATTNDGKKVILNNDGTWIFADCSELIKTVTNANGKQTMSGKGYIHSFSEIEENKQKLLLFKASSGAVILNFSPENREAVCVNKKAIGAIEFTDGSKAIINHMGDLDCEGNFSYYLSKDVGTLKELEIFKSKKIKSITIEYTTTENGKIAKFTRKSSFKDEDGEKIMKTIQCLSNS